MLGLRHAIAAVALSVTLMVLLAVPLYELGMLGHVLAQAVCLAGPAVGIAWLKTGSVKALGLRPARFRTYLGAAIAAAALWIWVIYWVAPIGESWSSTEQVAEVETAIGLATRPLWQTLFFFAVAPAVCEELLHRGMLLPPLCKKLGAPAGILLGGLFFGLSHITLSRVLPTAVLGVVAGLIRHRTGSLWPSMALHAIYNACILSVAASGVYPGPLMAPIAFVITSLGLALALRKPQ